MKNLRNGKEEKINHARVYMLITRNWLFNATEVWSEGVFTAELSFPRRLMGQSFSGSEDEARFQTS